MRTWGGREDGWPGDRMDAPCPFPTPSRALCIPSPCIHCNKPMITSKALSGVLQEVLANYQSQGQVVRSPDLQSPSVRTGGVDLPLRSAVGSALRECELSARAPCTLALGSQRQKRTESPHTRTSWCPRRSTEVLRRENPLRRRPKC